MYKKIIFEEKLHCQIFFFFLGKIYIVSVSHFRYVINDIWKMYCERLQDKKKK